MLRSLGSCLLIVSLSSSLIAQNAPLMGFSQESSQRQRALEARFDSYLCAENLRDWMKRLSARPHHLGSPYDKANAEFIAGQFRSWGYQTARYARESAGKRLSAAEQLRLDEILYKTERAMTGQGLPRRDWFRHQIYAPGFYTGYGVKTLPGIREALEQRDWREAAEQIGHCANAKCCCGRDR